MGNMKPMSTIEHAMTEHATDKDLESLIHSEPGRVLLEKIRSRTARVGVVGLGYVGLPLVQAVHDAGYRVIGFDVDQSKIDHLRKGESYLKHLGDALVRGLAESDRFEASHDGAVLAEADIVILCVPTPLGDHREPDLKYVTGSTEIVGKVLRQGQMVILESTTYPGTTRDEVLPILNRAAEERGLAIKSGEHFFVAYSPEREDPGRVGMATSMIPKIVGGIDPASGALATEFYRTCIDQIHPVASAEIGEAAKILENVYRSVNIALVNELKIVFDRMDIDIWEVIEAAKTKPFGFQAFYPGPGLGGHCIPIDPFYLSWKAKEVGLETKFIELAGEINQNMPAHVVRRVMESLNDECKALRGATILVVGLAYKPDVDDVRESPAAEIIKLLWEKGAVVKYHDPHIPSFPSMRRYPYKLESTELSPDELASADCVLVVTDHSIIDWSIIARHANLVVDTRNAMGRADIDPDHIGARIIKA